MTAAPPTASEAAPVAKTYRGTPLHAMRIPDDVWNAAVERAQNEGSTLTAEVVAFLRAYGQGKGYRLAPRRPNTSPEG